MKTSSIHQYSTCNDIHENNFSNIRCQIAKYDLLTSTEINDVKEKITSISGLYEDYFIHWFENNTVDWVFALNLTLSDAAPVSLALHNAAKNIGVEKMMAALSSGIMTSLAVMPFMKMKRDYTRKSQIH